MLLGWVSGYQYHTLLPGKPHLQDSNDPTLLHVKPVDAAASRASSLRLSLIVRLAESVSFKRGELAVRAVLHSPEMK